MKKVSFSILIIIVVVLGINIVIGKSDVDNVYVMNDIETIDVTANSDLMLKVNDKIKLNIKVNDFLKSSNRIYKWYSSNKDVAVIDNDGNLRTKNKGNTIINISNNKEDIKVNVDVYEVKKIIIVVGDSRMDHFKDDNNFLQANRYEIKYKDRDNIIDNYDRIYVVSLSGMRYNWLSGEDDYKKNNATEYVKDIIQEYEDKTTNHTKYEIKILFNLGVNDLSNKYLDTTPREVASKYLDKLDDNMNNSWKSSIIDKISLNFVTLLPVRDKQIKCYFPGRYNKDVIEFNEEIKKKSKYTVCDIYNDIDFNDNVFRERLSNKECATRDGLHFSPYFNKNILYKYLIDVCSNK